MTPNATPLTPTRLTWLLKNDDSSLHRPDESHQDGRQHHHQKGGQQVPAAPGHPTGVLRREPATQHQQARHKRSCPTHIIMNVFCWAHTHTHTSNKQYAFKISFDYSFGYSYLSPSFLSFFLLLHNSLPLFLFCLFLYNFRPPFVPFIYFFLLLVYFSFF